MGSGGSCRVVSLGIGIHSHKRLSVGDRSKSKTVTIKSLIRIYDSKKVKDESSTTPIIKIGDKNCKGTQKHTQQQAFALSDPITNLTI